VAGAASRRILFVIDGLGTGGSERSLAEMLPHLEAQGFATTVACLHPRPEGVEQAVRAAGFDVRLLPPGRLPARALRLRRLLRRLCLRKGPVLVHTTHFASDLAGRLAAAGTGVPVLSSLVNVRYAPARLGDPNVRRSRLALVRLLDGWTARHLTTRFHAVSRAVAEDAVAALGIPPDKVTVVPRGRDPERLPRPGAEDRRRARARLGLPAGAPVLVTVGRQEYQKGHRVLLEAVARLLPRRPDLVTLVAGRRGHATAELEALHARLGLGSAVRFLGHRQDVPEVLAAADLFVFPSLYEGLPGALIEALASAVPVVASDVPGVGEVVRAGENALLVPPERPAELAAAIDGLLRDPGRRAAFGDASRRIFEEEHTLERSVAGMVRLYEEMLGGRAGDGA
jgi:glycosyltransferase involved in cell wall biosynthesis